jgi:hypothetical protein
MQAAVVPAVSGSWEVKDVPQPQPGPSDAECVLSIENLRALGEPPRDILTRSGHTLLRSCEVMACLSSYS